MNKKWITWSLQDDTHLRDRYLMDGCQACAQILGRTMRAVYHRAKVLGLNRAQRVSHHHISGHFWNNVLHAAKSRGFTVSITQEDVWQLYVAQEGHCALTGWEIGFNRRGGETTASVDRIDSLKDYTLDNIQLVHKRANVSKMANTDEAFYALCKAVYEHRLNRYEPWELEWEWDVANDTEKPVRRRVALGRSILACVSCEA